MAAGIDFAMAQNWPTRPVTMVVTFAAGGPTDTVARILAPRMSALLGRQVIIENVGGAGGMAGSYGVARERPDGYQFVYGNVGTHAQNQSLYKKPLCDAATDFAPVGLVDGPGDLSRCSERRLGLSGFAGFEDARGWDRSCAQSSSIRSVA